ncbi:MAG: hypothetical protein HY783_03395 [Chloroflexi bacterium]|nr:hypothetical protein [Chloroflexota bacterium]
MKAIEIPRGLDKGALAQKAKAIYNSKYRKRLELTEKGKVVALEVESGEIFLGRTALEAGMKARQKFPDKIFYFIRVGYPAVHSAKGPGRRAAPQGEYRVPAGVDQREP